MPLPVAIANQQRHARVSAPRLRTLARWLMRQAEAHRARTASGDFAGPLSLALVDDAGIAPVNRRFVGHEGATDVISFTYGPLPGQGAGGAELLLNVQRALEESRRRRIPVARELALYLAHGILHLAGEDDATRGQRARMQRIQQRWLRGAEKAGLLRGLAG